MQDGAVPILMYVAVILIIVVYSIAKVVRYVRKSDEQWKQVDKKKLREWKDDED